MSWWSPQWEMHECVPGKAQDMLRAIWIAPTRTAPDHNAINDS